MDFPASPLWSFSLAVYRRPGVAAACLALQERHGVDVNLLLAALFAGTAGVAVDAEHLEQLMIEAALAALPRIAGVAGIDSARANALGCLAAIDAVPDAADRAAIERLCGAIPPSG